MHLLSLKTGSEKQKNDNIQIGDYAVIDDTYFNKVVNLLEKFVESFSRLEGVKILVSMESKSF